MPNSRRLISHEIEGAPARDMASRLSPMLLMRHVQKFDLSHTGAVQTLNLARGRGSGLAFMHVPGSQLSNCAGCSVARLDPSALATVPVLVPRLFVYTWTISSDW